MDPANLAKFMNGNMGVESISGDVLCAAKKCKILGRYDEVLKAFHRTNRTITKKQLGTQREDKSKRKGSAMATPVVSL